MNNEAKLARLLSRPMGRRQFLRSSSMAGLGLASSSILAACGVGQQTPSPEGAAATAQVAAPTVVAQEKVLTVALGGDPSNLNPNQSRLAATVGPLYDAVYDALTAIDLSTAEVVPRLAESWTPSDDGRTWTFKLREGVRFHNGEELTAEAVKLTMDQAIVLEASAVRRMGLDTTTEAIDKYTVALTTAEPYVLLPAVAADLPIYPAQYYAEVGDDGMAKNPIGAGQYRFVEQVTGGPVTLERFDDYWRGAPGLDRLVFIGMPEDATRVAALEAGEIDLMVNLPPDDALRLRDNAAFNVAWAPLGQAMVLMLIMRQDSRLDDVRVRQAFNYAIDKQALVDQVMLGFTQPLRGQLVGPDAFGHNPDVEPYPYDPDMAKRLLDEAGYADGLSIEYQSSQGRYSKQKEMSEALAGELDKVGIKTDLRILEWGEYVTTLTELTEDPLAYVGWNYYPSMDSDFTIQHYTSPSRYKLFGDPTLDDLYARSRAEFDPQKRKLILQEWHAAARPLAPVVFLFQSPQIFGTTARVQNFVSTPDAKVHLEDVTVAT